VADVLSQVDWTLRSAELGPLEQCVARGKRIVVMPLHTPGIEDPDFDRALWTRWLDIAHHPTMFEPIAMTSRELRLRYSAIDWTWHPVPIERERYAKQVATWGVELTRVFDLVRVCVPAEELGWFACPFAKIDVNEDVRVGFLNPSGSVALMHRVAPEAVASFPHADARALVFAIGQLLLGLVSSQGKSSKTMLGQVIMRCLHADPDYRFQSLADLREALVIVGGDRRSRALFSKDDGWKLAEQAIGYHLIEMPMRAKSLLKQAVHLSPDAGLDTIAKDLGIDLTTVSGSVHEPDERELRELERTKAAFALTHSRVVAYELPSEQRTRSLDSVRAAARAHVAAGRYPDALALYNSAALGSATQLEILVATAECHLLLREYGPAVDFAQRALAVDAREANALSFLAEGQLKRRDFSSALDAVSRWIAVAPDDGHAQYVSAKTLLALGRLGEARDACDRAIELAPKHLPAMMLRRQVDRSIRGVRAAAGKSHPVPVDLPEHLRPLRELLLSGRAAEAITALERPAYADDESAKLLRADLLAFVEQLDAALDAYKAIGGLAGGVGQALALVKLGRPDEALEVCDALVKHHPSASEAHEARALVMQALGRAAEADEEFKRALAADAQRTQMRVKLASS
jgi:tetratricopeptide (TPR) repeat protein